MPELFVTVRLVKMTFIVTGHSSISLSSLLIGRAFSFLLPLLSLTAENSPVGNLGDYTAISSNLIMYPEYRLGTFSLRSLKYVFSRFRPQGFANGSKFSFYLPGGSPYG